MKTITAKKVAAFACALCICCSSFSGTVRSKVDALATASITSYVYDWTAADIKISSKSDDTVTSSDMSLAGTVNKAGTIKLMINGTQSGSTTVSENGGFTFTGKLNPGRNDVNLLFTDQSGKTTRKTFNYVYLQNYSKVVDRSYTGANGAVNNGHACFNSVQAAVNAAVSGDVIFVKNGSYQERVVVKTPNITIIGQDRDKTKIFYPIASKNVTGMTERNCMKIEAAASDFSIENLTVENSYAYTNGSDEQADAICVLSDRSIFANVKFVSFQDTVLTDSSSSSVIARQYFYKCYITGNVDFIYGRGRSYFEDCDIVGRYTQYKSDGCFTAPRTDSSSKYGYVFNNCRFTAEGGIKDGSYRLGRPWGAAAAAAFINCYMAPCVKSSPYSDMGDNLYKNARFREYRSFGSGAAINGDRPQLGDWEISGYTAKNVFADGTSSTFDYEGKMDAMYGGGSGTPSVSDTPSNPGQQTSTYAHNFSSDGSSSSYYGIIGSVQNDKGIVYYNNTSMDTCLKLDSKGSLSFTTGGPATVKLVTKAKIDNAAIYLNGAASDDLSGLSINGNTRTFTLPSAGTYTLTKGVGETYIYYIEVTSTSNGQSVTQPQVTQAPSSGEVIVSQAIFCSPDASSSGQGTYNDPTTVENAISKVSQGGVIWLKGGQYNFKQTISIAESNSGKAGAYKTIAAVPGQSVVFDFSALSVGDSNRGIVLEGSYWHMYGIKIQKAGDNGMLLAGDNNIIEMCIFANNQDTGLQVSRYNSGYSSLSQWPTNNYIKNCTAMNNCDTATMENADGFAAKLTCGSGNVFDGCMSYNNSDDGWDLYAKEATGPIGIVTMKNCIAFRNGYTEDGRGYGDCDGNGFKLGGAGVGSAHVVENCIAFENLHHGFTDNNNPLFGSLTNCTSYANAVGGSKANFQLDRCKAGTFKNLLSYTGGKSCNNDKLNGTISNSLIYNSNSYWRISSATAIANNIAGTAASSPKDSDFRSVKAPAMGSDFHKIWRNSDGSINTQGFLEINQGGPLSGMGVVMSSFTSQKSTPLPAYSDAAAPVTKPPVVTTVSTPVVTTAAPVTTTETPVTTVPQQTGIMYGDVNLDKKIDLTDLTMLSQYILGDIGISGQQLLNADVNGDGDTDITDLPLLRQFIMKDPITLGAK